MLPSFGGRSSHGGPYGGVNPLKGGVLARLHDPGGVGGSRRSHMSRRAVDILIGAAPDDMLAR